MADDEEARSARKRVLFVADDDALRAAFARAIARLGYEVDTASSAGDALEKARDIEYPVVITDLPASGRDRMALIEPLCAIRPDTAFVLAASDPGSDLRSWDRLDGAIASVVHKPPNTSELAQSLEHAFAFQRRRSRPPPAD